LPVSAGLVSTEQVTSSDHAAEARERIKVLAQRPELAKELQALGVSPDQAQERVDAMTDAEVSAVVGKLDALPAGGGLSTYELIIIVLLIIILAIVL
jgi:hypothetical protein